MFLPSKEADLALAARIKAADKHRCARQPNENAKSRFRRESRRNSVVCRRYGDRLGTPAALCFRNFQARSRAHIWHI